MKKKLQVFISSTYTDLVDERQAAVEAVLSADHIPAGMELFKSSDESQKETIQKWIDESDVYLLILGGRYGSIDEETGKSYTHWEYDYAGKIGKPRFAVVIKEEALKKKLEEKGLEYPNVYETKNSEKYEEFRKQVLNKTSEFFEDVKDIQIIVTRKLLKYSNMPELTGWVSGSNVRDSDSTLTRLENILEENAELKKINQELTDKIYELSQEKFSESKQKYINLYDRAKNIFKVLNLDNYYDDYDFDSLYKVMNHSYETYNVDLPNISEHFNLYRNYYEGYEDIVSEFLMIATVKEGERIEDYLSEIRVIMADQESRLQHVKGVNIKFIIIVNDSADESNKKATEFLRKVIELIDLDEENSYKIEIWDDKKIEELEYELVLKI